MGIRVGNYAIGSGGDYSTWSAFFAAIDPFISGQIVGTQISDITETGVVSTIGKTFIDGVWNGVRCNPGLTLNSNKPHYGNPTGGWKTTFTGSSHGFHIHSTGSYYISPTFNGLNIVAGSGISSSGYALVYNTHANYTNMTHVSLIGCIINGNNKNIYGVHVSGIYFLSECYNNTIINCSGAGIKYTDSSAQGDMAGIFANNSIALNNIGIWNDSNNYYGYYVLANAVIGNNIDYYRSPSKSGNFPSERNAFSDNTYSGGYTNFSNVSLNSVISLDPTSSDFLKTASGTILASSGSLTNYVGGAYPFWNRYSMKPGIRGNSRPYASGLTSIGADEFSASGSSAPAVGPTVFVSKPGFCWSTVPVDIDLIYSDDMTNFDLSKITVTNASINDMGWLVGSSRRRLRLTPTGSASLSITILANSAKSIATDAWANGYGPVTMSWYATDPTVPGESTYSSGVYTAGGPEVTIYGFPAYKVPGEAFTVYVQFDTGVYAFNTSELSTEFMIENGVHSSGVMTQSNPTIWRFTVTPDNNQLPLNMWIPAGVCQDTETYLNNNVSPLYTLTVEPLPVATLTVPSSRHDYVYPNQQFSIGITWSTLVSGFAASDVLITNASLGSLTGGTSGVYSAIVTPSGGSPITYYIPGSVCTGIASRQNNIASDIYSTTYEYSSSPGNAGGGNTGSGGIGGGIGSWGSGQPGGGTMDPTSSGQFTEVYLDSFSHNGSVVQLVHFPSIANTASGYTEGLGWVYDPVYGWVVDEDFVPSGTNQVAPYPIGWANAIPGTGMMYGSGYFTPNYASGVPYISYAFLDFNQQSLDITSSVKKALNKNQIYASDVEKGHIYLPPNIFLALTENEVHVTKDGNQWAKSWDLVVRDVWIILYNDFMWHLVMPKPRYIGNDLVYIETDIIKCGIAYNPWSFIYQKSTAHPLNVNYTVRGHGVGGFTWPIDGGVY